MLSHFIVTLQRPTGFVLDSFTAGFLAELRTIISNPKSKALSKVYEKGKGK